LVCFAQAKVNTTHGANIHFPVPKELWAARMHFSRDDSATFLAGKFARAFFQSLSEKAHRLGFTPGQFPVLLELWDEDGITQRQLLSRLDIEQATLANTLARMQRDGLIVRRTHPSDKRAQIIDLTDHGRRLKYEAISASSETDEELLGDLRKFERHLLVEYMRRTIEQAKTEKT
jgi:DNA-binding MarR family transcriptional regulator